MERTVRIVGNGATWREEAEEREREKKESQALGGGRRFLEEQVGP